MLFVSDAYLTSNKDCRITAFILELDSGEIPVKIGDRLSYADSEILRFVLVDSGDYSHRTVNLSELVEVIQNDSAYDKQIAVQLSSVCFVIPELLVKTFDFIFDIFLVSIEDLMDFLVLFKYDSSVHWQRSGIDCCIFHSSDVNVSYTFKIQSKDWERELLRCKLLLEG